MENGIPTKEELIEMCRPIGIGAFDNYKGRLEVLDIPLDMVPREHLPNEIMAAIFFTDAYALCPLLCSGISEGILQDIRQDMEQGSYPIPEYMGVRIQDDSIEVVLVSSEGKIEDTLEWTRKDYESKAPGTFDPFKELILQKIKGEEKFTESDSDYDFVKQVYKP